ncbi:MAG: hypothetical protein AB7H81_23265 [Vicinamibacterales bacterium]
MARMVDVRVVESADLSSVERAAIRRLLDEAFSGAFSDDDWQGDDCDRDAHPVAIRHRRPDHLRSTLAIAGEAIDDGREGPRPSPGRYRRRRGASVGAG